MAKQELSENICYIAGLFSKSSRKEKSMVAIDTGISEIRERFVQIAVGDLGIIPEKIAIGAGSPGAVRFYHSRVSKRLLDIVDREAFIFKSRNRLSGNYVAGMFDIAGHYFHSIEIRHVMPKDALMLENLGIHTRGDKIMNISSFMSLISGFSVLAEIVTQKRGRM